MRGLTWVLLCCALALFLYVATPRAQAPASPNPVGKLEEQRYCGEPRRSTAGEILRSTTVRNAFRKAHPCPVTGATTGACPGWAVDHVIPLACGGCDAVSNMQWLPDGLKSVAVIGKDRFERLIYCTPMRVIAP